MSKDPSWSCDACTLINPSTLRSCDACGTSRPSRISAAGGGSSVAAFTSSARVFTPTPTAPPIDVTETLIIAPPSARPPLCDCMASEHPLFSLCLHCGKVLCERERGPACSACGAQPGRRLSRLAQAEAEASAQKERLLLFDRTSAQRTTVIDDDNAYFAANSTAWLSPEEEQAAREAEAAARRLHARTGRGLRLNIDLEARQAFDIDAQEEEEARLAQLANVRSSVASSAIRAVTALNNKTSSVVGVAAAPAPETTDTSLRSNFTNPTLTGACASVFAALAEQRGGGGKTR